MDYYELLRIDSTATFDQIHRAYRSLAMQYHPDRNATPEAASIMSSINEAYSVLGEPSRRRVYDQQHRTTQPFDVAGSILRAAYDTLLKQGWIVTENDDAHMILENSTRAVRVSYVKRLDNTLLKQIGKKFPGFSVVLAVEIELPINFSFNVVIIDLVHSRYYGPPFPDEMYRALFAPFISP